MVLEEIVVVSGLPRSGTSMMMQILEAGGIKVITDGIRTADDDNKKGYYEYEAVKKLPDGVDPLTEAPGKVVKIISELLEYLPAKYRYKLVFMRRTMSEILASQKKMLKRRGKPVDTISDEEIATLFEYSLGQMMQWLTAQENIEVYYMDYNTLMSTPRPCLEELALFLGGQLDVEAMIHVPDQQFYRNRG